jgi:methionyl-tRNA formyltransferase
VARLGYLGTPALAVAPLEALVAAGHEIGLVVSRPDARRGRGSSLSPSPVKAAALELGLAVSDDHQDLLGHELEACVVVAYGRIIPTALLDVLPMLNLHFSLLPRWRGAAPVERAILAGDAETGVCVMAVEPELDTGPVYARRVVPVGERTLTELRAVLVEAGSELLVELLVDGVAGLPDAEPQVGEPTYAAKVAADELELDFAASADELLRRVRLERAFTFLGGRRVRVVTATRAPSPPGAPGDLVGLDVVTAAGGLRLVEVQPEGKRAMAAAEWRRGLTGAEPLHLGREADL